MIITSIMCREIQEYLQAKFIVDIFTRCKKYIIKNLLLRHIIK